MNRRSNDTNKQEEENWGAARGKRAAGDGWHVSSSVMGVWPDGSVISRGLCVSAYHDQVGRDSNPMNTNAGLKRAPATLPGNRHCWRRGQRGSHKARDYGQVDGSRHALPVMKR